MNKNYIAGRKLEYDTMASWRDAGYEVIRASGSHGLYDIVAFRLDRKAEFIQCKRVGDETTAKRIIKQFKETTIPSQFYHQVLAVKVKGKENLVVTV